MSDLAAFLLSCADTEEEVAFDCRAATDEHDYLPEHRVGPEDEGLDLWVDPDGMIPHVACDPARVLADCAALRQIIAEYLEAVDSYNGLNDPDYGMPEWEGGWKSGIETALEILTLPYRDREGWNPEWGKSFRSTVADGGWPRVKSDSSARKEHS